MSGARCQACATGLVGLMTLVGMVGVLAPPGRLRAQPAATALTAKAQRAKAGPRQVDEARTHFERGRRAYAAGRLDVAAQAFEQAYALAPTPELAFNLGRVHERLGQAEHAIKHYTRYLAGAGAQAPDRPEVEKRLAVLRAASAQLRIMLKQPPPTSDELQTEARRFFKRGAHLYGRGRYRGALAAFTAAHGLSKAPQLYFNLALTSERLGATRDAIDYYRAYLAALPKATDRAAVETEIARLRRLE